MGFQYKFFRDTAWWLALGGGIMAYIITFCFFPHTPASLKSLMTLMYLVLPGCASFPTTIAIITFIVIYLLLLRTLRKNNTRTPKKIIRVRDINQCLNTLLIFSRYPFLKRYWERLLEQDEEILLGIQRIDPSFLSTVIKSPPNWLSWFWPPARKPIEGIILLSSSGQELTQVRSESVQQALERLPQNLCIQHALYWSASDALLYLFNW